MSFECMHGCSVVDWLRLRIRPQPLPQCRSFYPKSAWNTPSNAITKVKLQSLYKSPVTPESKNQNAESPFPVEFKVVHQLPFSCKAVVKCTPKLGVDLSFKCTWILLFYTYCQGDKEIKTCSYLNIHTPSTWMGDYTTFSDEVRTKLTALAIQKDISDKKEGNMELIGNELLQTIKLFNCIQLLKILPLWYIYQRDINM